jgi:hypothetical protein
MAKINAWGKETDGAGTMFLDVPTLAGDQHYIPGLADVQIAVTGATTAIIDKWHFVTGTAADYTIGLPPLAGNAGRSVGFIFGSATGLTKVVTLDGNASETISGATTRIYWSNEMVVLRCNDAETDWNIVQEHRIPMYSSLGWTGNLTFGSGGFNLLANLTVPLELAAPAAFQTAATARITALRPGRYRTTAQLITNNNNSSATNLILALWKSGALSQYCGSAYNVASYNCPFTGNAETTLAVGEYLQLYLQYAAGSYATTVIYDDNATPTFNLFKVEEILK